MTPSNPNETNTTAPKTLLCNYKYRDIKVYSSDEWMANATKKYRKVYDRWETTYMRVEFSFFNKLFDEGDWETSIRLKCFFVSGANRSELCNMEEKRNILKDENIVYIRKSWGNDDAGSYWLRGDYIWEAYIDDVKVGESKFHIEDVGKANEGENLFFDIEDIKLFEGDSQAYQSPGKKYLKKFKQAEARYVWVEFQFKSKTAKDFYAEIFFNFYNDAGQLKGSHDYLVYVKPNTEGLVYTIYPGWGGDSPGRWSNDNYTLEVIFMDQLLATVPFTVGDAVEEGSAPILRGAEMVLRANGQATTLGAAATATTESQDLDNLLYESLAELNSLTGLDSIKTEVNEMVQLVKFYQETGKDVLSKFSLHTVFTGNPGTGKTTVARILSRIYKGLGILEKGHLVEVDREGLVAGYVGQTAIKTAEKVTEAMGGILFIDEAYALAQGKGGSYDFGAESIQVILKRMEDLRGKFGVIVAGYTGNMHEFIHSNPGLRSRFDKYFEFTDYNPEEMWTIATYMFQKEDVTPDEAAVAHLQNYFRFLYENRDHHFGNARTVRQVVGETVKNQHLRLAAMKKEDRTPELLQTVVLQDVLEFEIREIPKQSQPTLGFRTGSSN
jgi:hypothetical protein